MTRLWRLLASLLIMGLVVVACGGGSSEPAAPDTAVDSNGFPLDWPIALPPGSITDCDTGEVNQGDVLFSVVFCMPDDPDPLTASESYLATLEAHGFAEREPGEFISQQQTFLDGNGIEIFFQLVNDEATIVLIKPGN